MNSPLISVVVPIYNTEAFLKECIDSIANQSFNLLQVILVDNGSSDNSGRICDEFSQKDSRFVVVHKKHGSISSARNAGLQHAACPFTAFVDSDDVLCEDYFSELYYSAIQTNADIVICKANRMYKDMIEQNADSETAKVLTKDEAMIEWICHHLFGSEVWGKLFKTSIVDTIIFPEKRCEDMYYVFEAIKRSNTIYVIDKHLYLYRMHRLYSERTQFRRPVEDEKIETYECILDYTLEKMDYAYDQMLVASFDSIWSSVMKIYSARKESLQIGYINNSKRFIKQHWKEIEKSNNIATKNKMLSYLFVNHDRIFRDVFRMRNILFAR